MSLYFPRALERPIPNARSIVVVSDIEMGEPGAFDDFPHDAFLAELFDAYTRPPYDGMPVDLVLNGDIFDLLKIDNDGEFKRHISQDVALEKLERVLDSHPAFIEGLRAFGGHESGNKRIHMIAGNHDPELLFGRVTSHLAHLLEGVAKVTFHGLECRIGPVRIEHGHQFDAMFRMNPHDLFAHYRGERILKLPWGNVAMIEVANPLRHLFYHHERLVPRHLALERMPLVHELLLRAFKKYWTRDYIVRIFREWDDPTRPLSWNMVKAVLMRFYSGSADVEVRDHEVLADLHNNLELQAVCQAHLHAPTWRMSGTKLLMRTGCMRDEFMINRYNDVLTPVPKSYGELVLQHDYIVDSRLFYIDGPERDPDSLPEDVFAFTPEMNAILQDLRAG